MSTQLSVARAAAAVMRFAALLTMVLLPGAVSAQPCPGGRLLLLTNGRIHTMDAQRTVVAKARIANGRFVEVGNAASADGGCTDTLDLGGRTVIPGMIDNHFHVQLVGSRPGYETRAIETAFSIAEVQNVLRERARGVPEGAFITAIGGLQPRQFAENRLPTLAELDAAAPQHPVYIHVAFNGPAVTNSLGKTFFESKGVAVAANGLIAVNGPTWDALDALRAGWTLADTKRTMQQNTLGTIAAGRHADFVVLNRDVFDPAAVPDEEIRRVHSVLTMLGGQVVHGDAKTLAAAK